jgi:hypothetical protein
MGCQHYRVPGLGRVHICFTGRRKAPPPCVHCGDVSTALCDHQVADKAAGWPTNTCDAPTGERCALHVPGKNRDYCKRHAAAHRSEVPPSLPFEVADAR